MRRRTGAGIVALAGLAALAVPVAAAAAPAPTDGRLRVVVSAPDGVPANVDLTGPVRHIAAKPPAGTSATSTAVLPVGAYHVDLPRIAVGGVPYVGTASRPNVDVRPDREQTLEVRYAAEPGARALHATAVDATTVSLAWSGPAGARYALRRTLGLDPVHLGPVPTEVRTTGTTATDVGLRPGTQYSYWLYTQLAGRWYGPLPVVVGTTAPAGSGAASYVAAPGTLLAAAGDLASTATTGDGVRMVLQRPRPTLLVGAAVVLPISAELPGGYLGVVTAAAGDGRTFTLAGGGLSDAFDYYELAAEDFSTGFGEPAVAASGRAGGRATTRAAAASVGCTGTGGTKVSFTPSLTLGGSFTTKLDKYRFLGQDVPVGASLDLTLTATVTGAATVTTSGSYTCTAALPTLVRTLTVTPVPISVSLAPAAKFTAAGAVSISNLGVTATGGVHVAGSMTPTGGPAFSGDLIRSSAPLTPVVSANGKVGLKVGGVVTLGPGVGTAAAGVIAGVSGDLQPLDASFTPYFSAQDSRFNACTVTTVAFSRDISLTAKAWLNDWKFQQKITLGVLSGSTPYLGSPWHLPTGCTTSANVPPDSLLGPGVTKVSESTGGSPGQWGHLDGFAPGTKTWVLSTGRITDAVGTPGVFANTDLGGPGDAGLTALAGRPTWDAAAYTVTVVPTGDMLHVRYVFASEEYPEYVGSEYNDVMAVRVNGADCARVPGGTAPVSVNTINAEVNSAYFVDNSTGAAGYSTSMDGLTKPLTCSVPVTPGQPVTVQVAVADTSDGAFDSAVALVDGGIWTD
jgi:hypothetical protein